MFSEPTERVANSRFVVCQVPPQRKRIRERVGVIRSSFLSTVVANHQYVFISQIKLSNNRLKDSVEILQILKFDTPCIDFLEWLWSMLHSIVEKSKDHIGYGNGTIGYGDIQSTTISDESPTYNVGLRMVRHAFLKFEFWQFKSSLALAATNF